MSNRSVVTIIKPPKEIDANRLVKEEIHKRNMICPFCGEMREGDLVNNLVMQGESYGVCHTGICRNWYGKHDEEENPWAWLRFGREIFIIRWMNLSVLHVEQYGFHNHIQQI